MRSQKWDKVPFDLAQRSNCESSIVKLHAVNGAEEQSRVLNLAVDQKS